MSDDGDDESIELQLELDPDGRPMGVQGNINYEFRVFPSILKNVDEVLCPRRCVESRVCIARDKRRRCYHKPQSASLGARPDASALSTTVASRSPPGRRAEKSSTRARAHTRAHAHTYSLRACMQTHTLRAREHTSTRTHRRPIGTHKAAHSFFRHRAPLATVSRVSRVPYSHAVYIDAFMLIRRVGMLVALDSKMETEVLTSMLPAQRSTCYL